jgi:F-type H+-transporting ATPase subunit delta
VNAVDPVTARYADALYGLARRQGRLEAVVSDVQRLAAQFQSPKVSAFLLEPRLAPELRLAKLRPVLERLDPLTQKFVRLLFGRRREAVLARLGAAFRQKRLQEAGAVEGVVESARPLDQSQLDEVRRGLKARLGLDVLLENRIVPSLIGGVRVTVGSRMIDTSIQGRLQALGDRLQQVPLSAGGGR